MSPLFQPVDLMHALFNFESQKCGIVNLELSGCAVEFTNIWDIEETQIYFSKSKDD